MASRRLALVRPGYELLLAAIALQRLQLGLGLRVIGARCDDLQGALRPWLARRLVLALAAAPALRRWLSARATP